MILNLLAVDRSVLVIDPKGENARIAGEARRRFGTVHVLDPFEVSGHPSAYRDIKRNGYTDEELPELNGYHAVAAQDMYEQRRAIHRKIMVLPCLVCATV